MSVLQQFSIIDKEKADEVKEWMESNYVNIDEWIKNELSLPVKAHKTFGQRSELCEHVVSRKLFSLMEEKQTNLCVSADFTNAPDILKVAEETGPYICILKTHVDIIEDFSIDFIRKLKAIAAKYKFLIFEDR